MARLAPHLAVAVLAVLVALPSAAPVRPADAYGVTGSVSANGTDALSCSSARGHAYLFRQTQPSGFVYDICAPRDPSAIASSGTLAAGSYEFYVDAIAHTNGGTSDAAADVTLTLGP